MDELIDYLLENLPDEIRDKLESQLCTLKLLGNPFTISKEKKSRKSYVAILFKIISGNVFIGQACIMFEFKDEELYEIVFAMTSGSDAKRFSSKDSSYINVLKIVDAFI